jgi:hypothetical protein
VRGVVAAHFFRADFDRYIHPKKPFFVAVVVRKLK